MTKMTELEFETWFAATDLGPLETEREYVEMHALSNGFDADDIFACAKATVEMYLDDLDASVATFIGYRN